MCINEAEVLVIYRKINKWHLNKHLFRAELMCVRYSASPWAGGKKDGFHNFPLLEEFTAWLLFL